MSNQRIDLNQFKAMTKGNWEIIETPTGGIDVGVKLGRLSHQPVITFTQHLGEQVKQTERDMADLNAIVSVPKMIAELERMYERENAIIRLLKGGWFGKTCWFSPSEWLRNYADDRGILLNEIANVIGLEVDIRDTHEFKHGCGNEDCNYESSE